MTYPDPTLFGHDPWWLILAGVLGSLIASFFGIIDWLAIERSTRAWTLAAWHGVATGGVTLLSQLAGTVAGVVVGFGGGYIVYGVLKKTVGIRLSDEEEFNGADLSIHQITATPERESNW